MCVDQSAKIQNTYHNFRIVCNPAVQTETVMLRTWGTSLRQRRICPAAELILATGPQHCCANRRAHITHRDHFNYMLAGLVWTLGLTAKTSANHDCNLYSSKWFASPFLLPARFHCFRRCIPSVRHWNSGRFLLEFPVGRLQIASHAKLAQPEVDTESE